MDDSRSHEPGLSHGNGELVPPARIGFVGTGVMGSLMAGRLLEAGYSIRVHNRSPERAASLLGAGAQWASSPGDAAIGADVVITIVGTPDDVREIYLGHGGILEAAPSGAVAIDMTTSEPTLAREIALMASGRGIAALDAPVSGGDIGAREGTLSIMVGGEADALARVEPVLRILGTTIIHQGAAGSGQHTKMANQIAVASTTVAVMEALAYARAAGLDPERVQASIGSGAAGSWAMTRLFPKAAAGDFAPGFAVRHFRKDLAIAAREAGQMHLELGGMELAVNLLDRLAAAGGADQGTQALIRVIGEAAGSDA
jgi:3-hydroxyisobutyrate dehydrogenase